MNQALQKCEVVRTKVRGRTSYTVFFCNSHATRNFPCFNSEPARVAYACK